MVTLTPNTGAGTSQRFTLGRQENPTSVANTANAYNILFAASLDGRNACWIYVNNGEMTNAPTLWLASDDGTSWTAVTGSGSVSNSQCTLAYDLTVTFKPAAFA